MTPPTPEANAGPDQVVFDEVTLDGGASSDPVGTIISYQWTLEHRENPAYNRAAEGVTATVSKIENVFYDVILTVTNSDGCPATDIMLLGAAGPCSGSTVMVPNLLLLDE